MLFFWLKSVTARVRFLCIPFPSSLLVLLSLPPSTPTPEASRPPLLVGEMFIDPTSPPSWSPVKRGRRVLRGQPRILVKAGRGGVPARRWLLLYQFSKRRGENIHKGGDLSLRPLFFSVHRINYFWHMYNPMAVILITRILPDKGKRPVKCKNWPEVRLLL